MRLLTIAMIALTTSTAAAQHQTERPTHEAPHLNQPVRSKIDQQIDSLQSITLHDYEVWIAKDPSKMLAYRLHLKTQHGWSVAQQSLGSFQLQDRIFDSESDAMDHLLLLMATSSAEIIDFHIEAIVGRTYWEHVETFDREYEAEEFLELLLSILGDDYIGYVAKVRVPPAGLTR